MLFHYQDHKRTHERLMPKLKYRLKESWIIAILFSRRWTADRKQLTLLLNVFEKSSMEEIAESFALQRRCRAAVGAQSIAIVSSVRASTARKLLTLPLAILFTLLPYRAVIALAAVLARLKGPRDSIGVFCDSHLSGFLMVHALRRIGVRNWSLQHGLYRADDLGSEMAFANQCSDQLFIWDEPTEAVFRRMDKAGAVRRVGQYKYAIDNIDQDRPRAGCLIGLCPPYDETKLAIFTAIERELTLKYDVIYSLHPSLRHLVGQSKVAQVAAWPEKPVAVISGDSGVILDCLARNIPVITISDRKLASTGRSYEQLRNGDEDWPALIRDATRALEADRLRFGFLEPMR